MLKARYVAGSLTKLPRSRKEHADLFKAIRSPAANCCAKSSAVTTGSSLAIRFGGLFMCSRQCTLLARLWN